jgi:virulence-associated protein VagC
MQTTKVFKNGHSQAVRIPKDDPWELFKKSLTEFSDDFFAEGRNQPEMQNKQHKRI